MAPAPAGIPDRGTIWRRRLVLMAVVGLLVGIPATILVSGDGGATTAGESLAEIEVKAPDLGPKKVERSIGVELRVPDGWSRAQKQDVIKLRSADGLARVAISAPGPAADAGRLHSQVLAGLRSSYRDFEVTRRIGKAPVGGLKGEATVASAALKSKGGSAGQRILVATAEGKKLAYLAVVFTPDKPSRAVLEAQALVNNLRFTN